MNSTLTVFRKEIREMFRDKRVRSAAFIGPIFLIAALLSLFGFIFSTIGKKENQKVHLVKTKFVEASLLKKAGFQVIDVDTVDEGRKLVVSGKARVLLEFLPRQDDGQIVVNAYLDPKNQPGEFALAAVQAVYRTVNQKVVDKLLESKGIPKSAQEPIKVERKDLQVGEKGGASEFVVSMLPYLIVVWAFYGAMSIAGDMVAGEKDKNTLETLLITPVKRTNIVMGKFLALGLISLMSSMSSLVGMALVAIIKPPGTDMIFKSGFGLNPTTALLILAIMVPLVALFSAILVAVSSYARNPREAQTYLTQVSFVVIMPAVFSQFIGFLDAGSAFWVNYIPILNAANNIRLALLGKPDLAGIATTVALSSVLAIIALRITVVLFNREEVLVRV